MNRIYYNFVITFVLFFTTGVVEASLKLINFNGTGDSVLFVYYEPPATGVVPTVLKFRLSYLASGIGVGKVGIGTSSDIVINSSGAKALNNITALSATHVLHTTNAANGVVSLILAPKAGNIAVPAGIIATIPILKRTKNLTLSLNSVKWSDGVSEVLLPLIVSGWVFQATINTIDSDGDGTPDLTDLYPSDPLRSRDTDADGIANYDDPDDDNDGILDAVDAKLNVFPRANAGKDITADVGETVTLDGTLSSDIDGQIVSYRWEPASLLVGANTATPTYAIPSNSGAVTQSFVLTVKDDANDGSGDTVNVIIVNSAPSIIAQPLDQTVDAGQSVTLTVIAKDYGALQYQWRRDGVNITGATNASYATPLMAVADSGVSFNCVVSNSVAQTSTRPIFVTVNRVAAPLVISTQPTDQTVAEGSSVTFTVAASGSGTLRYQWQLNGVDIAGATASSFTIAATTLADIGDYVSKVSGLDGSVSSNVATLNVTPMSIAGTRVTRDLQALYNFSTGVGNTVADRSGVGSPLNLTISGDVTWTASGLSVNTIGSISSDGPATKINEAIKLSNAFTIEAWITPSNQMFLSSTPVGAIVTIQPQSTAADLRNVYLGQALSQFTSYIATSFYSAGGLFTGTGYGVASSALTHVVLTRENYLGRIRVYVDGVEKANVVSTGELSSWNAGYPLTLSSDSNLFRLKPWTGVYHLVAIYDGSLTAAEVNQNFTSGPLGTGDAVIAVEPPPTQNIPPVAVAAIASFDTPVVESSFVYMAGTGSTDNDGIVVSHKWVQTAGPAVTMLAADTPYPYFYAPTVTANSVVTIQLTVTDDKAATATASVSITVTP